MKSLIPLISLFTIIGCNPNVSEKPKDVIIPVEPENSVPFSRGAGMVEFKEYAPLANKPVNLWYYNPVDDASKLPIVIVCHGASRNGDDYRDNWIDLAIKYKLLIIAPEFSKNYYPKSAQYNLGNMFYNDVPVEEQFWTYSIVEPIFEFVVQSIHGEQTEYDIFGHSAGAQFVHRFMTYKEEIRANRLIAANAGWYTMPDTSSAFPYGLKGSSATSEDIERIIKKSLIILLGDADTLRTDNLRRTPEADLQGWHRFARGHSYFNESKRQAANFNIPFAWRLDTVPGIGHDNGGMASFIGEKLYGDN